MKFIVVFSLLVAGISAFPQFAPMSQNINWKDERLVTGQIESAIEDLIAQIQEAGLDPFLIESVSQSAELPVPVLFSIDIILENMLCTGLSNIVINNLNFSILTYRLTFDISLPSIASSVDNSSVAMVFFGKDYTASASGSLSINNLKLNGNIRVSVGIITGVSLRSLSINFSLGGIESNMNVVVQSWDLSNYLNTLFGTTIPTTLNEYSSEINELLEIIVTEIAEQIL